METNELGQVALKYHQPIQKYVRLGNNNEYLFMVRANISLAWVNSADVENVLNIRKSNCSACGNKPVFRYANSDDTKRWLAGGGR